MWTKRKYKRELLAKMEQSTPKIASLEALPENEIRSIRKKGWIIGLSVTGATAFAIAGAVTVASLSTFPSTVLGETALTSMRAKEHLAAISTKSAAIYRSFAKNIVPLIFADEPTSSRAFSLVDSFVAVSMTVYCSNDAVQNEYATLLGASSMDEVNEAAKEIGLSVGTTAERTGLNSGGGSYGGKNINSLWLDSALPLAAEAKETLAGIEDNYYASVYHAAPTSELVNGWFKDNAPEGFSDLPKLDLADGQQTATVSAYYVNDSYLSYEESHYFAQYESRTHLMDYTLGDGTIKKVNYIESQQVGSLYQGSDFQGVHSQINSLSLDYFLPDVGASLSSIIGDVVKGNYHSEGLYRVNISAPYFRISTENLEFQDMLKALIPTMGGTLMEKLIDPSCPLSLGQALQSSVLKYDYHGFYAASLTAVQTSGSAQMDTLQFAVDRPYDFEVTYPILLNDGSTASTSTSLPLFYGQILDPAYRA